MIHLRRVAAILFFALLGAAQASPSPAPSSPAAPSPQPSSTAKPLTKPWLFVSDVHWAIGDKSATPAGAGDDTNAALLDSFLAGAKRVAPDPPVVVIAGDFLGHHFANDKAAATMAELAKRFDATFPHAQFLIALGNNDSACGDYAAPVDGSFLATTAKAWAPLVDRNGASPTFARDFAHDGGYVATLPIPHLRAVVFDDVFASLRYDRKCATNDGSAAAFATFERRLASGGPQAHNLVLVHIPPGIDAFSTAHISQRTIIVPFMAPEPRDHFIRDVGVPEHHVAAVIAGHAHRFAFRLIPAPQSVAIPLLDIPSVSPIYQNAPSFLTANVEADGTLAAIDEFSFHHGAWTKLGSADDIGLPELTADGVRTALVAIESSKTIRDRWAKLYVGGGRQEIFENNWRAYWCASQMMHESIYANCMGQFNLGPFTFRGLFIAATVIAVVFAGIIAFFRLRAIWRKFGPETLAAFRNRKNPAAATGKTQPKDGAVKTAAAKRTPRQKARPKKRRKGRR